MARYLVKILPKSDSDISNNWRSVTAMEQLIADLNGKVNSTTDGLSTISGKIKVSTSDKVSDYLNKKLIAGSGISLTKSNTGGKGSEILTVASTAASAHTDLTDMPDTAGTNVDHDARYRVVAQAAQPTTTADFWYDTDAPTDTSVYDNIVTHEGEVVVNDGHVVVGL